MDITRFYFISKIFISNARLKLAKKLATPKLMQKLSNTLRLNIRYLKNIRFIHPRYHPKIKGDILKNVKNLYVYFNDVIKKRLFK